MSERRYITDRHGTHNNYSHGCRCEECKVAHRVYTADRRRKALAAGTLSHGKSGTYDAGCRCEKCWYAKQVRYYTTGRGALTEQPTPRAYPGDQRTSRLTA